MSDETQSGYRARRSGPARFLSAYGQEIVIAGAIIVLFVVVSAINPRFLRANNVNTIISGNAYIAVAAIGMTMIIITGNIDVVEVDTTSESLIRQVARGNIALTVAQENVAQLEGSYFENLAITPAISAPHGVAWVVRDNAPFRVPGLPGVEFVGSPWPSKRPSVDLCARMLDALAPVDVAPGAEGVGGVEEQEEELHLTLAQTRHDRAHDVAVELPHLALLGRAGDDQRVLPAQAPDQGQRPARGQS